MGIEMEHIESHELNLRGLSQAQRILYKAKIAELLVWVAERKFEPGTRYEIRYAIPHEYGQYQSVGLVMQSEMMREKSWVLLTRLENPEWHDAIGAYIAYRGEVI